MSVHEGFLLLLPGFQLKEHPKSTTLLINKWLLKNWCINTSAPSPSVGWVYNGSQSVPAALSKLTCTYSLGSMLMPPVSLLPLLCPGALQVACHLTSLLPSLPLGHPDPMGLMPLPWQKP